MLQFRKVEESDKQLLGAYFKKYARKICDDTVILNLMWAELFDTELCVFEDTLYMRSVQDGFVLYCVPMGENLAKSLKTVKDFAKENHEKFGFFPVLKDEVDTFTQVFDYTEIFSKQDWYDYVYLAEDLANFRGKKYHSQKNHINQFNAKYKNWKFVPVTTDMIGDVLDFIYFYSKQNHKESEMAKEELHQTMDFVARFEDFDLMGFALLVDEKIVAVEFGEIVDDTFFAHIEKADRNINGAYSMIVNQVAKYLVDKNVVYINREEDDGEEGLRVSKRRYRPAFQQVKYRILVDKE